MAMGGWSGGTPESTWHHSEPEALAINNQQHSPNQVDASDPVTDVNPVIV
jgi:hypothetical protein